MKLLIMIGLFVIAAFLTSIRLYLFGFDWGYFDVGLGPWSWWDAAAGAVAGAGVSLAWSK